MRDFVLHLLGPLLQHPESVRLDSPEASGGRWILHVHKDDRARVIGRRGKTIHAIRDLCLAHGERNGHSGELDLFEESDDARPAEALS